jgi:hypothetical protein
MALKVPTTITKEWIQQNCRCQRREDRLLCRESCPVHSSFTEMTDAQRKSIATTTRSMGLLLEWCHEDQHDTAEKRR